jgi:hypothetical protein
MPGVRETSPVEDSDTSQDCWTACDLPPENWTSGSGNPPMMVRRTGDGQEAAVHAGADHPSAPGGHRPCSARECLRDLRRLAEQQQCAALVLDQIVRRSDRRRKAVVPRRARLPAPQASLGRDPEVSQVVRVHNKRLRGAASEPASGVATPHWTRSPSMRTCSSACLKERSDLPLGPTRPHGFPTRRWAPHDGVRSPGASSPGAFLSRQLIRVLEALRLAPRATGTRIPPPPPRSSAVASSPASHSSTWRWRSPISARCSAGPVEPACRERVPRPGKGWSPVWTE